MCQWAGILRFSQHDSNTLEFSRMPIPKVVCDIRNNPEVLNTRSREQYRFDTAWTTELRLQADQKNQSARLVGKLDIAGFPPV